MKTLKKICYLSFLLSLSSCAARTIYVSDGAPVQLAKEVKNAPVWVFDANGVKVQSTMTLPEGFWVIRDTRTSK